MEHLSVFHQRVGRPEDPVKCRCGADWEYRTGTYSKSRYWCSSCYKLVTRPKIKYKGRRIR